MWCANCMQPVNGIIDHKLCKENIWEWMSEEYTRQRDAFVKQYMSETVEVRQPLTRSRSHPSLERR